MILLFTANEYVSLNKLHAMRPHGTITDPSEVVASGAQLVVSVSLALLRSCLSLLLLTYLGYQIKCAFSKKENYAMVWVV